MTNGARKREEGGRPSARDADRAPVRRQCDKSGGFDKVQGAEDGRCGHPLLDLQREFGNQAVQHAVTTRTTPIVQRKMRLGPPDDQYEREADHVAEEVVRTARSERQRAATVAVEDDLVQSSPHGQGPADQTEAMSTGAVVPPSVQDVLRSTGRPLEPNTQTQMEASFGHDFSRVRVHDGARAAASARDIDARAYTSGQDVVFGAGQYAPATHEGRRLLAHELTHVVQQTQTAARTRIQRQRGRRGGDLRKRVTFPFAQLGVTATTPERLYVEFVKWHAGLSEEAAVAHWNRAPPGIRRTWEKTDEQLKQGAFDVLVPASPGEFAQEHVAVEAGEGKLPSGRAERHEERASEFQQLSRETKQQITSETDRRYWEATGLTGQKIQRGEADKAEAWLRIRDQVLAEREFLQNLPARTKLFIRSGGRGPTLAPKDYPQLIRISKLIMDMTDEEVNEYLSGTPVVTDDLTKLEESLQAFIAGSRKATEPGTPPTEAEPETPPKGAESETPPKGVEPAEPGSTIGEPRAGVEEGEPRAEAGGKPGEGKKRGSKYGRFGLIDLPQPIIDVLEAAAELLGDPEEAVALVDLFDEITDLRTVTEDVVNVLGDPENLLLIALGLLDNPAVASLDQWVFKPESKRKPTATKKRPKGIGGVLRKIRSILPTVRKMLKPVFLARRKSMGVQFRATLLIDELPASVTSVLERTISGGPQTNVPDEVTTLADTITKRIVADLQSVPKTLSQLEATGDIELINKEELGRIVSKLVVKLAGGLYGKAAAKVGLDEVIADITKHGAKHAIPDAAIEAINGNLNRILTEFKPLIQSAASEVTEVLDGLNTVLKDELRPQLMSLVSPKASTPGGASPPVDEAGFVRRLAASKGSSMSGQAKRRLSPVFGSTLESVQVHTDQAANEASESINADAFAIGSDVYFGPREFDEQSSEGLGLIAHELTHVVQHARGAARNIVRRRKAKQSLRKRLATRLVGRVLRGTGKTKRSIRGAPFIDYGYLDGQGRPRGIIARLKAPLGSGSKASRRIRPPGYKQQGGHARCHLLGKQLGGSGRDPRNLVACHQALNVTDMIVTENQVRAAVEAGETVLYKVIPEYRSRRAKMPYQIRIVAKGDGSPALNIDETFQNRK